MDQGWEGGEPIVTWEFAAPAYAPKEPHVLVGVPLRGEHQALALLAGASPLGGLGGLEAGPVSPLTAGAEPGTLGHAARSSPRGGRSPMYPHRWSKHHVVPHDLRQRLAPRPLEHERPGRAIAPQLTAHRDAEETAALPGAQFTDLALRWPQKRGPRQSAAGECGAFGLNPLLTTMGSESKRPRMSRTPPGGGANGANREIWPQNADNRQSAAGECGAYGLNPLLTAMGSESKRPRKSRGPYKTDEPRRQHATVSDDWAKIRERLGEDAVLEGRGRGMETNPTLKRNSTWSHILCDTKIGPNGYANFCDFWQARSVCGTGHGVQDNQLWQGDVVDGRVQQAWAVRQWEDLLRVSHLVWSQMERPSSIPPTKHAEQIAAALKQKENELEALDRTLAVWRTRRQKAKK
eukprot:CAMPEP_0182860490 /NCGR_PEP_ID=MMETSP0034_2-20130328/4937_1 /TAXON_ID=156128 /ORGANISM="Nephroselmis pyriformis, Strain CCMP717" /LENGTH=405 /DNA_ID=CAMNT_0024992287 /DNA_START=1108 /DNA_END=2329 /DNA_ORIENTATION=+